MATIYNFEVKCVSPFCSFDPKFIEKYIKECIQNFNVRGNKLESIEIREVKK